MSKKSSSERFPLKCILFSEFDHIVGPRMIYQVPETTITADMFETISEYIITKPNLCGMVATVSAFDLKLVGCPMIYEHAKYPRNYYLFNVCFIFEMDVDTVHYFAAVRKLNQLLQALEKQTEFLSRETKTISADTNKSIPNNSILNNSNAVNSETITNTTNTTINTKPNAVVESILRRIWEQLNQNGNCCIAVDETNIIALQLQPILEQPPEIQLFQVPVYIRPVKQFMTPDWDFTLQTIVPHIDGVNHVRAIARVSQLRVELVKRAVQHLCYYKCVQLVNVFLYGNEYAPTPSISKLFQSIELQDACSKFVALNEHTTTTTTQTQQTHHSQQPQTPTQSQTPLPPPAIEKIIQIYCALKPGITYRDVSLQFDTRSLNIDDRKLVIFGEMNHLIRLHRFALTFQKQFMDQAPPQSTPKLVNVEK